MKDIKHKILLSISYLMLFCGVFITLLSCTKSLAEDIRPNVLMISADDLKDWVGYLDGYEGKVHTPNIDKLASMGVAFTNAHTAATVCSPSRNALLLGKRPSTTGLYNNQQWWKAAHPQEVSLPGHFKKNGYFTAGAGKVFHHTPGNNPPCSWDDFQDQVFDDTWRHAFWGTRRYFEVYGYRGPIEPFPGWKPANGMQWPGRGMDWGAIPGKPEKDYGDVKVVEYAADFLGKAHKKPFFLALGIYRPHLPWHVPQKYYDMYPIDEIVVPTLHEDDLDDIPIEGQKLAKASLEDFETIREQGKWKEAIQAYLASITFADDQVGKILDLLEQSDYKDNTIIVSWSDHGWHLGTKQHWHKKTLWEECTRIPLTFYVPGITRENSVCNRPVDLVNIFPTLLSLCDLPGKPGLDGHDLTSLLKDPNSEWRYPALTEIKTGNMAVRSQAWRYIRYHDGTEELYNLEKDPFEYENLVDQQVYQAVIEQHAQWIPKIFVPPAPRKTDFYFDPHDYTFMDRKTKAFIDGKKL